MPPRPAKREALHDPSQEVDRTPRDRPGTRIRDENRRNLPHGASLAENPPRCKRMFGGGWGCTAGGWRRVERDDPPGLRSAPCQLLLHQQALRLEQDLARVFDGAIDAELLAAANVDPSEKLHQVPPELGGNERQSSQAALFHQPQQQVGFSEPAPGGGGAPALPCPESMARDLQDGSFDHRSKFTHHISGGTAGQATGGEPWKYASTARPSIEAG